MCLIVPQAIMLALHKLKIGALRALCEEREIDYSGCNKKQLIAMLKEAEKERDVQSVEEGGTTGVTMEMRVRQRTKRGQ